MKHAIEALSIAREAVIQVLKGSPSNGAAVAKKKELEAAITILRALAEKEVPTPLEVVALEAVDFGPFAEYRLLWDYESEDKSTWREIPLRLSPGDIVLKAKEPNQPPEPTAPSGRGSS